MADNDVKSSWWKIPSILSDTLTIVNKSLANYAWNIFVLPAPHLSLSFPPDAPLTTVLPHPSLVAPKGALIGKQT